MHLPNRAYSSAKTLSKISLLGAVVFGTLACVEDVDPYSESEPFPRSLHSLAPPVFEGETRVAAGESEVEIDGQPLAFNHSIHAGVQAVDGTTGLEMDCQYCHSGARRSPAAGVPPTQVCWNCHNSIDPAGREALATLEQYCEPAAGTTDCQGDTPIPWTRVHDLPDFVTFNHSMHVRANENDQNQRVECQECHGNMEEQTVANRESSLLMGWCLDCHENHESINENYGTDAELRRAELKDCYTCHK
jgi:hypothetical protein